MSYAEECESGDTLQNKLNRRQRKRREAMQKNAETLESEIMYL